MATPFLSSSSPSASSIFRFDRGCADVFLIPMFKDNYGFVLVDRATKLSACIDPAQPERIIDFIEENNLKNDVVLCTHKHNDHAGGNLAMQVWNPNIKIIATNYETIPGRNVPANDGDVFTLGSLKIETLYTPCHTVGHVCFLVTNPALSPPQPPILFCGDTLFVGGCGRFFEGTANDMVRNMNRLAALPDETFVFCAHEYTLSNYDFLRSIDPRGVSARYEEVKGLRARNLPTIPR